jgi:hypothetical protein
MERISMEPAEALAGLVSGRDGHPPGIPCPKCGALIELKIEDLLRKSLFRCRQCGLELTLNRFQSREALEALDKLQSAIEPLQGENNQGRGAGPTTYDGEKLEQVGPIDPALRTSPIIKAGENAAEHSCWYNGKQYSNGSLICQVGEVFQCSYGYWVDQRRSCQQDE